MWRTLFDVVSEVFLIVLAGVLGTFAWNHGSDIFNHANRWKALNMDITTFPQAYIAFFVGMGLFILILWLRYRQHKNDEDKVTRKIDESNKKVVEVLNKILAKLERNNGNTNK